MAELLDVKRRRRFCFIVVPAILLFWLHLSSPSPVNAFLSIFGGQFSNGASVRDVDPCRGRYIYVHDLPRRFNDGMLDVCGGGAPEQQPHVDVCKYGINEGMGFPLKNRDNVFLDSGWFATPEPGSLEVIFWHRMKRYECLTNDSAAAAAFFVPFYGGIDAESKYFANVSARDAALHDLASWLIERPEWSALGGSDHFAAAGVVTWSVRRVDDQGWGSALQTHPVLKKMVFLDVEATPWPDNDYAVPYPSYFHPKTDGEVVQWQEKVRSAERPWLFTFVGGYIVNDTVRPPLIEQCRNSSRCRLMQCDHYGGACHVVSNVMGAFESADFCLQPRGDTYTRRSIFDSLLAACIPVFFNRDSAYTQYTWHLPADESSYSVFIPEADVLAGNVSVEERLSTISRGEVRAMREVVIGLIPRLLYRDHDSRLQTADAFDVALDAAVRTIAGIRTERARRQQR